MTQAPDRARGALADPADPLADPVRTALADPVRALADLVAGGGVVILSGAGISTESGIPDYRGPSGLARRAEPMTYQTFTGGAAARRRYWARSHHGWRHIAAAVPNAGHRAVAELQRRGLVAGVITQNVDGLHQAAGTRQVIELHGSLYRVVCLGCGQRTSRAALDQRLRAANPGWAAPVAQLSPDGDAVLADAAADRFRGGGLPALRRPAQARRRVLRRERAPGAGRGVLRADRASQRPSRAGILADRDVRLPVCPARGQTRHTRSRSSTTGRPAATRTPA